MKSTGSIGFSRSACLPTGRQTALAKSQTRSPAEAAQTGAPPPGCLIHALLLVTLTPSVIAASEPQSREHSAFPQGIAGRLRVKHGASVAYRKDDRFYVFFWSGVSWSRLKTMSLDNVTENSCDCRILIEIAEKT